MNKNKFFYISIAVVFIAVTGVVSGTVSAQSKHNASVTTQTVTKQTSATSKLSSGSVVYLTKDRICDANGNMLKESDLKIYKQQDPETGICLRKNFRVEDWNLVAKIFEIPLVPQEQPDSSCGQFGRNMREGLGLR